MKFLKFAQSFSAVCLGAMIMAAVEYGMHPVIIIGMVLSIADYILSILLLIREKRAMKLN